ncbi:MAG: anion permease, partial [Holosporales bacterium]|nr:anion permease [Holosporales bacterium]
MYAVARFVREALRDSRVKWAHALVLLCLAAATWIFVEPSPELSPAGYHAAIIFVATMASIMLEVCDALTILFVGIISLNLTSAADLNSSFSGFANTVPWLLFCILSLSKVITNSSLGMRIAYLFMKWFGKNLTGLSYSMILTELLMTPAMPSSTARTASVGLPLSTAIAQYVSRNVAGTSEQDIGRYMIMLYSLCCSVCCATFLTGMVSNALIVDAMT